MVSAIKRVAIVASVQEAVAVKLQATPETCLTVRFGYHDAVDESHPRIDNHLRKRGKDRTEPLSAVSSRSDVNSLCGVEHDEKVSAAWAVVAIGALVTESTCSDVDISVLGGLATRVGCVRG